MSWIAELLQFRRDGDAFVVPQPNSGVGDRLFGGLIAAQALAAAGATVDADKLPQSLHLYFVRGGKYGSSLLNYCRTSRRGQDPRPV